METMTLAMASYVVLFIVAFLRHDGNSLTRTQWHGVRGDTGKVHQDYTGAEPYSTDSLYTKN